jgi:hypothetical protein
MVVLVDTVTVAENVAVYYIRVFSYSGNCLDRHSVVVFRQQPQFRNVERLWNLVSACLA